MQLAATGDGQNVGVVSLLHAQADVCLQLAQEPLTQLARRHETPLAPGKRRGVDAEGHLDRRLLYGHGMAKPRARSPPAIVSLIATSGSPVRATMSPASTLGTPTRASPYR